MYYKTCPVCLKSKSENCFYQNQTGADGLCSICKICSRDYCRYKREKAKANRKPLDKIKIHAYVRPLLTPPEPRIAVDHQPITIRFE